MKSKSEELCYFYLGQAEGIHAAQKEFEKSIEKNEYILNISPGVYVVEEENQDMERLFREEELLRNIFYQMDEIYMNVGKEYGLFSPRFFGCVKTD